MTGTGVSHGCVSVINGIVNGTGAVIGVALKTTAVYEPGGDGRRIVIDGPATGDNLARICVREAQAAAGVEENYTLTISSEIPPSRGLKSSSSVCNAVIKAVLYEHGVKMDVMDVIKLGVRCAKEARVTVTGSFDDACGCELGGFIKTSNYDNEILERRPADHLPVVICVPDHVKRKTPRSAYEARAEDMKRVLALCDTDVYGAMTLNGRIISEVTGESGDLIDKALESGAVAAGVSGTGPAVAVVCREGDAERVASLLPCETLITEMR